MSLRTGLVGLLLGAGIAVITLSGCTTPVTTGGDASAGQSKFAASCATCHSAASLKGASSRVVNNLGSLTPAMTGITLTDQEVADIKAFLLAQ